MLDKLLSFKMPENITISISSLTVHNHFNVKIGDKVMAKSLEELLAEIKTIASAGSVADVQAQVDSLKTTASELTQTIANNAADDEATKKAVTDLSTAFEALVDQLAAAKPPEEPTGGDAGTGTAGAGETA